VAVCNTVANNVLDSGLFLKLGEREHDGQERRDEKEEDSE